MEIKSNRRRTRASLLVMVAAVSLVLAGCSGDGPSTSAQIEDIQKKVKDLLSDVPSAADPSENSRPADDETKTATLEFLLPTEATAATGWILQQAKCVDRSSRGWLSYATPKDWEATGWGAGGSGGLEDTMTRTYRTANGEIDVSVALDRRNDAGKIVGNDHEVWTSFDYDSTRVSSSGEKTTRITFAPLATVTLGEQSLELFVAEKRQAPEVLRETVYKTRIQIADLSGLSNNQTMANFPMSYTVTIDDQKADTATLSEVVKTLLGTLAMPTCVQPVVLTQTELIMNRDLNGDGKISSGVDYQQALAEYIK